MGLLATRQAGAIKKGGSGSEIRWNQLQDPSSSTVSWHLEQMSSWNLSFFICKKTVRFYSQGCCGENKEAKVPAHSRCSKNTDSCPVFVAVIEGSEAHRTTLLNNSKEKLKISHLINVPHSHMHPHTCVYAHTYTHTCMHVHTCTHACTHTHARTHRSHLCYIPKQDIHPKIQREE